MSNIVAPSLTARLRSLTTARVGLGRTGVSQETRDLLSFQQAHAMARDAVHARLGAAALATEIEEISGTRALLLRSRVPDRTTYLQRPDLGRQLDQASLELLALQQPNAVDLVIVVADGLSALAVERHAPPLLLQLLPMLDAFRLAPICIVEQGRVAIGDAIGEALRAELCIVLLGERPGLSSPDSLGAYITWDPRAGRTDAERNCISNIRAEGLSYAAAVQQVVFYATEARRRKLTGIDLKEESNTIGDR